MSISENHQSAPVLPVQKALVAMCALGTFLLIWQLLKYSAYGIDFTDESFYLVWIANPFLYDASVYLFGFIYHPLYILLGGDIAFLRQSNILITFGLAWILTYIFLVSLVPELKENRITLLTVSAGFATSAFILFDSWLPTPSYNSLAMQSLLISTTGLILADKSAHRPSIIGWVLIGVGGWLAFMAKPTSAIALAVGVFIYLLLARKLSIRMLALAIACSLTLLLISALLIDGSLLLFFKRIQLGVEFIGYLGGGHTKSQIFRIDQFQLNGKLKTTIFLVSVALLFSIWSMCTNNKKWLFIGLLISIVHFLITALLTLGQMHRAAGFGQFQGLLIFAVVYAATAAALVHGRLEVLKTVPARQWSIAALFLVMPHIYAFGTNGNYWQAASSSAFFWLLAGLTLLGPLIRERASWVLALPLAVAAQAVTASLLQSGLEQPYRQPQPLRLNFSKLEIGPQRSALTLSEDYSEYITSAMATAKNAGFDPNMPIIDLSGQSPGILYSLGAKSIGQAWIIGGYPGSLNFAEASLSRTSCENIGVAWILFEPDGPRSISSELMSRLGADFPGAYKQAGMWQTAEGAGGHKARRTQQLYRPVKPQETMANCQMLRQKSQK